MNNVFSFLDFDPNQQQRTALEKIVEFIKSDKDIFILKGSAGTGQNRNRIRRFRKQPLKTVSLKHLETMPEWHYIVNLPMSIWMA